MELEIQRERKVKGRGSAIEGKKERERESLKTSKLMKQNRHKAEDVLTRPWPGRQKERGK